MPSDDGDAVFGGFRTRALCAQRYTEWAAGTARRSSARSPTLSPHQTRRPLRAGSILVAALVAATAFALSAAPSEAEDGERPYDDGPRWEERGELPFDDVHGIPYELAVTYFTDCSQAPGLTPPSCGSPPARWVAPDNPVEFCTFQSNRPPSISAQAFRAAVIDGAAAWNATQSAVGVLYIGDCPSGSSWQKDNNRNEIAFDDGRNVVQGQSAAITLGAWRTLFQPSSPGTVLAREFAEADIVMDEDFPTSGVCFTSTIAHEMGHAIGFGHSDASSDLMFPSFNPNNPASCPLQPSSAERAALQSLYGVDLTPTVSAGTDRSAARGSLVTLAASATDPEGAPLSIAWTQVGGPNVGLGAGASPTFTAPSSDATLTFEVTATDPFLHSASDRIVISVTGSVSTPSTFPVFVSFLPQSFVPSAVPGTAVLGWSTVDGASSYQLCSATNTILLQSSCETLAQPDRSITWDTVLGSAGPADATRVFTSGWRLTRIQACGSGGCSQAVEGPIAGGVRWASWGIDYDFLAMTFDIAGFEFTFGAVVNVSGPPRQFYFGNGPVEDPFETDMGSCLGLRPGGACFTFLDFSDGDQDRVVGIRSSRPGTPTVEHHILVR